MSGITLAPVTSPAVTAGLMWQPDTWPMVWATVATVTPKVRAMRMYWACIRRVIMMRMG